LGTFDVTDEFWRGHKALSDRQKALLKAAIEKFNEDLDAGTGFRAGLRVKGVRAVEGLFEMTWDGDGRATFSYGEPVQAGLRHVIWHEVGNHSILP
jgi:hypothetical protein